MIQVALVLVSADSYETHSRYSVPKEAVPRHTVLWRGLGGHWRLAWINASVTLSRALNYCLQARFRCLLSWLLYLHSHGGADNTWNQRLCLTAFVETDGIE